jgi:hypothetical protein
MLSKKRILDAFKALDVELGLKSINGEICIVGGAYMCLAYDARPSTKDVDGVFKPATEVRAAASAVAATMSLPSDWLNDGVKGFMPVVTTEGKILWKGTHLLVWGPEPEYVLAMKVVASRTESSDIDDFIFLAKKCSLSTAKEIMALVDRYYPRKLVPQKILYLLDELEEQGRFQS